MDAPSASIQCDTGMKQVEEYVKHLMCSYVSEYMNMYGIIARFALMELGVKVKVASALGLHCKPVEGSYVFDNT